MSRSRLVVLTSSLLVAPFLVAGFSGSGSGGGPTAPQCQAPSDCPEVEDTC
jgi:hypothetical protein